MQDEQQNEPNDTANPAAASSASQSQEHPSGVVPADPIRVPDERVAQSPQNPTVTSDQPVTEPARQPDQNDTEPDVQPNPEPAEEPSN
jgi:hypothetical protein